MEKDIDISAIYFCFIRNKLKIIFLSFLVASLGAIYSLIIPRTWEGSFEIVMRDSNDSPKNINISESNALSLLLDNNIGSDSTELQILQSPLVLTPVYDYYQFLKKSKDPSIKSISYEREFKSRLAINQVKTSKVLKIKFQEVDKDIILKVLNKLSRVYQDYSNEGRTRILDNSIDFINSQLSVSKDIRDKKINDLQEFTINNSLGTLDGFILDNETTEIKRPKRYESQFLKLSDLESEIVRIKSIYKKDSLLLKRLEREKKAFEKSLRRPSQIINQYRNKLIEVKRQEKIYQNLTDQLFALKFERARINEPWQLISNPKISNIPVSPYRKRIVFLSLIGGFLFNYLLFYFKDIKSNILYVKNQYINYIPYPLLKTISLDRNRWKNSIDILFDATKSKKDQIIFLNLINESSFLYKDFLDFVIKNYNSKIFSVEEINVLNNHENIILLTASGVIKKSKLDLILEEFKLLDINIIGFVYIDRYINFKL